MIYAGIGSGELVGPWLTLTEEIGRFFAHYGHVLYTGNAEGADQGFARGANQVNPALVHLYKPWRNHQNQAVVPGNHVHVLDDYSEAMRAELLEEARVAHKKWEKLGARGRLYMSRNGLIIAPPNEQLVRVPVDLVIAIPNLRKWWGGGTGQGIKLAKEKYNIPVVDLNVTTQEQLTALCESVRR